MEERIPHVEPLFEDSEFVADYSRVARRYAGADYEPLIQYTLNALEAVSQPRVIELGPGPGWCGIEVAGRRNDISVVGLDTSESYVEIANANAVEAGVADRAVFRVGDACSLGDHDDNSLDAVISSQSFHYWETPVEALNEIGRILKPGGVFYITSDRRDLTLWATIVVTLTKWLLPKSVRESWMRSFQGAFTIAEVREIVGQSELSDVASITTRSRMYSIIGKVL